MRDLTVLLSLWNGWRPIYTLQHVRSLAGQIREYTNNCPRIVLLTDDQSISPKDAGVDEVGAIPVQSKLSPEHPMHPNCYRRVRFFDAQWSRQFGTSWIASMDLDTLITSNIDGLLDYAVAASSMTAVRSRYDTRRDAQLYNGAFFAVKVGTQQHLWDTFDWQFSPAECSRTGQRGSDQVWISLKANPRPKLVGEEHGVYFFERHIELGFPMATLISFAGVTKPWSKTAKRIAPRYFDAYQRFATA